MKLYNRSIVDSYKEEPAKNNILFGIIEGLILSILFIIFKIMMHQW